MTSVVCTAGPSTPLPMLARCWQAIARKVAIKALQQTHPPSAMALEAIQRASANGMFSHFLFPASQIHTSPARYVCRPNRGVAGVIAANSGVALNSLGVAPVVWRWALLAPLNTHALTILGTFDQTATVCALQPFVDRAARTAASSGVLRQSAASQVEPVMRR